MGCEEWDITEIPGADSLYEAAGIIAESEANASRLFGCPTFYSTEGSSHCIRAMLLLACKARQGIKNPECRDEHRSSADKQCLSLQKETGSFRVLAARNVHRAFLSAAALLDLDVAWLPPSDGSYLSAQPSLEELDAALTESGAEAVYLTCPDYLGFLPDLGPLAEVCHAHGALLLVDNAHGAYLHFLHPARHPMDLGADLCSDSAHKTLPVLTGGAYLHAAAHLFLETGRKPRPLRTEDVRDALALFGSTSPSYLILQSLDLANPYLERLPEALAAFLPKVEALKGRLRTAGWDVVGDEPMKLTICCHSARREESVLLAAQKDDGADPSTPLRSAQDDGPGSGLALAAALEQAGICCEFADPDYIVFMLSPGNADEDLARLETALKNAFPLGEKTLDPGGRPMTAPVLPEAVCSIREAMLAPAAAIPAAKSLGRILARPGVSCPPAVPILMPGERIDEAAIAAFERYGIQTVSVL